MTPSDLWSAARNGLTPDLRSRRTRPGAGAFRRRRRRHPAPTATCRGSHQVDPGVADLDEAFHHVVEFGLLALVEADRLELPQTADERLQHAANRRGNHLQRP
jgi:hypothetical protein